RTVKVKSRMSTKLPYAIVRLRTVMCACGSVGGPVSAAGAAGVSALSFITAHVAARAHRRGSSRSARGSLTDSLLEQKLVDVIRPDVARLLDVAPLREFVRSDYRLGSRLPVHASRQAYSGDGIGDFELA